MAGHCSSVVPLPTLISSLMIWWLAACCSSPLVRVIVLPCLVVSIIPVYSSSPARMLPLPSQSPAPPGLILMVLSKIHLAAQLRCQRRSLHSTLYNSTTLQLQLLLLWKCSSEALDMKFLYFAYTFFCRLSMTLQTQKLLHYLTDPSLIILFYNA